MDYLARDTAPFDEAFWQGIDQTVVNIVAKNLTLRKVLPLYGPLGADVDMVQVDSIYRAEEVKEDHILTTGRSYLPLTQIYEDYWLYWRDLAAAEKQGAMPDLSAAMQAAANMARKEDAVLFYGIEELGVEGLLNADGAQRVQRGDWMTGEEAFKDIASGMTKLETARRTGKYVLIVSPDLYLQLNRLQANTGMLEIDRLGALLGTKVRKTTVLKENTAVLLSAESRYMDICVGLDMASAYLEQVDLNHHFRLLETIALRVKMPDAIVIYE